MKTNEHSTKPAVVWATLLALLMFNGVGHVTAATWTRKADMPTPRFGMATAVVNDKIYVVGGNATETARLNSRALAAVEEYDPATDTWTRKRDLPTPGGYLTLSAPGVDGRLYLIGGGNPGAARVDIYDPVPDTWSGSRTFT